MRIENHLRPPELYTQHEAPGTPLATKEAQVCSNAGDIHVQYRCGRGKDRQGTGIKKN